jgi:hypothetical protein
MGESIYNSYYFIDIYLQYLNDDFNYVKFLKRLYMYDIIFSIEKWFRAAEDRYFVQYLSMQEATNFRSLINKSLFNIIIENEVNLRTFKIETLGTYYNRHFHDEILELILRNPNFIHSIRYLKLHSSTDFSFQNVY